MQIIETQAFSIEEVARMFNIAPHKNKSSSTIDNNIEQQTLDHASDTIQPFITNIEQEYAKLFTSTDLNNGYYIRGINMNCFVLILNRVRNGYHNGVLWCDVSNEARQYEDMNDGPALLNEFLLYKMSGLNNKLQ
jgi:phage portal protein BeeE